MESVPEASHNEFAAAFMVRDVSINTRILYQKLLWTGQQAGARLMMSSRFRYLGGDEAELLDEGGRAHSRVSARLFIYTAGFGVASLFKEQFGLDLPRGSGRAT